MMSAKNARAPFIYKFVKILDFFLLNMISLL